MAQERRGRITAGQLKPYIVTRVKKWYRVTCPRKDCGHTFFVHLKWKDTSPYQTRPCPYCFKVSKFPDTWPKK